MRGRIHGSASVAARAFALTGLVIAAAACGASSSQQAACPPGGQAKTAAAATPQDRADQAEAQQQREAQKAWCSYLEALYLRASPDSGKWPKFEQCTNVMTTASPRLLTQTADCSLKALKAFEGDPFTSEYASEVSRCGSEALDEMAVSQADLAPFVAVICGRASSCGDVAYGECRAQLTETLGPNLERAIGAMNSRGRSELTACLRTASCQEVNKQVAGCLEPIMDRLLYLPG